MDLTSKYTNEKESAEIENKEKIILTNDAYALAESISDLTRAIIRLGGKL